jgi:uncharacterized protein (TIGR00369 family)
MNAQDFVQTHMEEMKRQFQEAGIVLDLPPASNVTLHTRYTDIDPGKMLTAEIPFDARFANPIHVFQGGFLCAAFDEVFGPLSYMAAQRPVVAIEISTSFIRPFAPKDEYISIRAQIVSQTKSLMIMKAEAKSKTGKLIAISSNHALILSDEQMKKI